MTEAERTLRIAQALASEESLPERWWWLSFTAKGQQFLGACLVRARGLATAMRAAHRLECNPGGEVCGVEAPEAFSPGEGWANRLLTRAECAEFDRVHMRRS